MFVNFIRQHHHGLFVKTPTTIFSHRSDFSSQEKLNRQFPKCIFVQPPVQWLMCKLNFQRIKSWDSKFDEKDFRKGAKQVNSINFLLLAWLKITVTKISINSIFSNMLGNAHAYGHCSKS